MAINDVKISQLPELAIADVTDETMILVAEDGLNYQLSVDVLVEYVAAEISAERPLGEMSLTAVAPSQTFTGSGFTQITAFDKIQYERDMDVDITTDAITLSNTADYRVTVNINAEFNNNQGVEFAVMLDGVVVESLGTIQGRGAGKPVYIGGADIDPLTAGQVITLGAREDAGASVDIIFHKVRITVEGV